MRARAIIGSIVLLLVFAACSGDTTETTVAATAPPASSTTTSLAPVTTTTVAPTTTSSTTTTTLAPEVPYPDLTIGDDPVQLWLNIIDFFNWMEQHPDPDLVTVIFHEDAEVVPRLQETYTAFMSQGLRYTDPGIEVMSVIVISTTDKEIVLETVDRRGDQTVEQEDGTLFGVESGWDPVVGQAVLTPDPEGRWKVASTSTIRDATPQDLERPEPR